MGTILSDKYKFKETNYDKQGSGKACISRLRE